MGKSAPHGKMVVLWILGCMVFSPLALVWLGLWLVDRSNRERGSK